ncbi:uncharacterized protein [Musca autumnalis]|uniref:uncharacterized protein n=1 Tax=Musca autumnalis TaxID=221902 RepID=UPI003CE6A885
MLEGWYCRTLNEQEQSSQPVDNSQNVDVNDDTDSSASQDIEESQRDQPNNTVAIDYKSQYIYLKRKLKFLIYENEFFQDALRSNQRRLLKVSRDRAFLLDRLLQYEKPENTSSESEETEDSSDDEATKEIKRRKSEQAANISARGRKKKIVATINPDTCSTKANQSLYNTTEDRQQPQRDVEQQLDKGSLLELMSVPKEMFSNEPSLDSEPNEQLVECSSPTHVAAEECVPMEYSN